MRALSDQMEPAPPQVQELRRALEVSKREQARAKLRAAFLTERAEKAEAEVARLREWIDTRARKWVPDEVVDAALAKGGGDG